MIEKCGRPESYSLRGRVVKHPVGKGSCTYSCSRLKKSQKRAIFNRTTLLLSIRSGVRIPPESPLQSQKTTYKFKQLEADSMTSLQSTNFVIFCIILSFFGGLSVQFPCTSPNHLNQHTKGEGSGKNQHRRMLVDRSKEIETDSVAWMRRRASGWGGHKDVANRSGILEA